MEKHNKDIVKIFEKRPLLAGFLDGIRFIETKISPTDLHSLRLAFFLGANFMMNAIATKCYDATEKVELIKRISNEIEEFMENSDVKFPTP